MMSIQTRGSSNGTCGGGGGSRSGESGRSDNDRSKGGGGGSRATQIILNFITLQINFWTF